MNKAEIINDTSSLTNQVNNRLDKGDFKRKDPSPIGTSYQGFLQDKKFPSVPQQQQQQYVNKSKSETGQTVQQINKQQQLLPGQKQQQQQLNRTSNLSNNKNLLQQQQQQSKSLLGDKRQAPSAGKDRPVSANRKPVSKPGARDLSRHIPQFYFPMGQPPQSNTENETVLQRIKEAFAAIEGGKATRVQMGNVAKVKLKS